MDIKHTALADPSNHVRTLEAGSGQKAVLTFSEKTSEISAILVSKDGMSHAISKENCPKDFENIKTLDNFNGFLENAQARGTMLSDGEAKLYVQQKGLGGMYRFNPGGGFNVPAQVNNTAGMSAGNIGNFTPPTAAFNAAQMSAQASQQFAQQQAAQAQAQRLASLSAPSPNPSVAQHLGPQLYVPNVPNMRGVHVETAGMGVPGGIGVGTQVAYVHDANNVKIYGAITTGQFIPFNGQNPSKPSTTISAGIWWKH